MGFQIRIGDLGLIWELRLGIRIGVGDWGLGIGIRDWGLNLVDWNFNQELGLSNVIIDED